MPCNERKDSSLSVTDGANGTDKPVIECYDALKVNKISSFYRYSQSRFVCNSKHISIKGYNPGKSVPRVYFSGLWLENYGFEKGKKFAIYGFKNYLVLKSIEDSTIPDKIGERRVKDSSITIGRINS